VCSLGGARRDEVVRNTDYLYDVRSRWSEGDSIAGGTALCGTADSDTGGVELWYSGQ
jgi:hypothetical protein